MSADILALAAPGVRGLSPYQPGKPIEELEREYGVKHAVKLASNENPLGPSPRSLAAMRAALDSVALYPDGNGFVLKHKLGAKLGVPTRQITLGNGSSDILDFAVRAFVTPASEVLFSEHAFAIYPILAQAAGARAVAVPARKTGATTSPPCAVPSGRRRGWCSSPTPTTRPAPGWRAPSSKRFCARCRRRSWW